MVELKAIVLAAGLGSRMGDVTADKPKAMITFIGQPIIHRNVAVLNSAGINDIVIVGGYCAEELKELGLPLVINERFRETNMVYSLFCAEEELHPGEGLIIAYGDIVYEKRLLEALFDCQAPLCIVVDNNWREYWKLRMIDPLTDAETLKMVDGNRIIELGKKAINYEEIEGQYIGLIKVAGEEVDSFKEAWFTLDRSDLYDGRPYEKMFMTSFLQLLIDSGWEARAVLVDNGWLEFDTEYDLGLYESLYKEGHLGKFYKL